MTMETQFKSSAPSKNEKQVGQREREGGVALIIDNRYKFMIDISLYCIGISIILSGIIIRVIWIMPLIIYNTRVPENHKPKTRSPRSRRFES